MKKQAKRHCFSYVMPDYVDVPRDRYDVGANIGHFLMANGLGIFDSWRGKIRAVDQRRLFGRTFGKRTLTLDGESETVIGTRSVCFGLDSDDCDLWDLKSGLLVVNCMRVEGVAPWDEAGRIAA